MLKIEIKRVDDIDKSILENSLFCLGNGKKVNYKGKKNSFHIFGHKSYDYYYLNSGKRIGDTENEELFIHTFKKKNK